MFRGTKELQNISKIKVKEDSSFKYLIITNTKDSSCICTLNSLKFKSKGKNSIKLFMGDDLKLGTNLKETGPLQIGYEKNNIYELKLTELYSVENSLHDSVDLLSSHYAILIPDGSLVIEMKEYIYEAELNLNFTIEEF